MTQVDFYLTQSSQLKQAHTTACKLAEKASHLGHHVFIHADDEAQAQQLDKLLWTFKPNSFIPHRLVDSHNSNESELIMIGYDHEPECKHDVLINLASTIPDFFSRFERVAEIVSGNEEHRQQARQRFKFYRDRGYDLNTHEIKG